MKTTNRERHYIPAKERIGMFYGELQRQLRRYDCKKIERDGSRLTIKTELKTRYPEEKKETLEIETEFGLDLISLLTCPDNELDAVITECVVAVDEAVKKHMIYEGMYRLCGFLPWI